MYTFIISSLSTEQWILQVDLANPTRTKSKWKSGYIRLVCVSVLEIEKENLQATATTFSILVLKYL